MKLIKGIAIASAAAALAACGGDDNDNNDSNGGSVQAPQTYTFPSKLTAGESSVSYSGQVARNVLINQLKGMVKSDLLYVPVDPLSAEESVKTRLNLFYLSGTDSFGTYNLTTRDAYTLDTSTPTESVFTEVKNFSLPDNTLLQEENFKLISSGKSLVEKMAGFDNTLARDNFYGWDIAAQTIPTSLTGKDSDITGERSKPHALVEYWIDQVAQNAQAGDDTPHITASGVNYEQLIQKFLLGAVSFSQASRDYLYFDKGLTKDNSSAADGTEPYTELEHQWDEGFGYFGAARDYNSYSDSHIAADKNYANDSNGDRVIDLDSEYTFAVAQYANKRDNSIEGADYSKTIFDAFLKGRQLIQDNFGTNPVPGQGYHVELSAVAKTILEQWEEVYAANIIHYINATIADLAAYEAENLETLAKHWSEMKGFALAIQFNPQATSKLSDQNLIDLNNLIGQQPTLPSQVRAVAVEPQKTYTEKLEEARGLLKDVFAFGDDVTTW